MQKIFIIGIGGIGVSAVARYYNSLGKVVSGSDKADSELLKKLNFEGITTFTEHNENNLDDDTNLVIYSEAIITKPDLSKQENLNANPELAKARKLGIRNISYPEALAEIVNSKKCIAICGTHGKSTTTSMIGVMLKDSIFDSSTIVGTQVSQLGNSNFYFGKSDYFVIEACEYKRSFLKYNPFITVITNIELDHLDYYKDLDDYIDAFNTFQNQTSGIVILNGEDENCKKLKNKDKNQIWVYNDYFTLTFDPSLPSLQAITQTLTPTLSQGEGGFSAYYTKNESIKENYKALGYIIELARKFRKNSINSEKYLWQMLKNRQLGNLKFRRQHPIGRYIADFYCEELKLAIELDGELHEKIAQKEYDQIRNELINNIGISVLRIKNETLKNNTEEILNKILEFKHNSTPSPFGRGPGGGMEGELKGSLEGDLKLNLEGSLEGNLRGELEGELEGEMEGLLKKKIYFPGFNLQVPGKHIEFDAKLAFIIGKLVGLEDNYIIKKLNSYSGAWRRSEIIKKTSFGNILMSDYGHHPTEIQLTLKSIKEKYFDKKLFVIFQPHQYSRTIELLNGFKKSFDSADDLIIPDIYFSRDKKEDVETMPATKFVEELQKNYPNTIYGNGLENTLNFIKEYDKKNPESSIIILLGAGNIDELRNEI